MNEPMFEEGPLLNLRVTSKSVGWQRVLFLTKALGLKTTALTLNSTSPSSVSKQHRPLLAGAKVIGARLESCR